MYVYVIGMEGEMFVGVNCFVSVEYCGNFGFYCCVGIGYDLFDMEVFGYGMFFFLWGGEIRCGRWCYVVLV